MRLQFAEPAATLGGHVPLRVIEKISAVAKAKGMSISAVVRQVLLDWFAGQTHARGQEGRPAMGPGEASLDPLNAAKFRHLQAECAVHRAQRALAEAELEVKLAWWSVQELQRVAPKEATS